MKKNYTDDITGIPAMSVAELSAALAKKEISAAEAAEAYLKRIHCADPDIGAYITVTEEAAMKTAAEIDKARMNGEKLPPLAGIPCGIKDNICTKGIKTTCASRTLENFIPPYNAHVCTKLGDERVTVLGKLNMDEYAMGSSTETSYFRKTKNPWNTERVPGGSSGGSAAAVAAGEAAFALGSDTGGSVRQPASFCGVVGIKPTYGRVSRYGLIAFASSLDQIGVLTRSVYDNALVLSSIAGYDKNDATSENVPDEDFTDGIDSGIKGLKIGVPDEFFGDGVADEVKTAVLNAAKKLESLGTELVRLSMPTLKYALPAYYVISGAEASSNLARFDGVRYGRRTDNYENITKLYSRSRSEGFGTEVKRRIMMGTFALSSGYYDAYYKKALSVRTLIINEYSSAFGKCDAILSPVAPTAAYKTGEKTDSPLEMYMGDIFTVPVNIAGIPAISVPCGKTAEGLPVGMQLAGRRFEEKILYRIGYAFEKGASL